MSSTARALLHHKLHLLFLLLLECLTSCHSEKAVFRLHHPPLALADMQTQKPHMILGDTSPAVAAPRPVSTALKSTAPTPVNRYSRAPQVHARSTMYPGQMGREAQRISNTTAHQVHNASTQHAGPYHSTSKKGTFLQIVGTVLAVAGVVLGFAVGGWVGFGYFVLLALAGLLVSFWGGFIIDGNLP